ncbi:hypothetical protein BBW65_06135 [Helicobacter enhydrae]|uniref:Methyltransferase domain-containing protein n=1 Tax=Helicobacter enhydrae TaxID=222136 RepID=A0A1B1U7Q9_9HELI|nr:hypothetical protein BBW65_06135 [Helicobacter enhydrae]
MFVQFLKNPTKVGAVCSSSQYLAKAMVRYANIKEARYIAEIGAGLGAFTKEILIQKPEASDFFAVEISSDLTHKLKKKFPNLAIYNQNASDLKHIMHSRDVEMLDVVVSGLPWSVFPKKLQNDLLDVIEGSLRNGGKFVTFAYVLPTPQALKFRKLLFAKFPKTKVSKIIWANFPPAVVYCCQK